MKAWILLGVLSTFTVSSVFPLKEGSRELEKEHYRIQKIKVTENPWNYSFPNNNTNNDKSIAKNAVLIIVESSEGEDVWKKLKNDHSFLIEGFLSSCKKFHTSNHSLLLGGDQNCQCEKLLKQSINELIIWAQLMKGMNTATISSNNSILSSILNNGNPIHDHEKFPASKENRNNSMVLQHKPKSENSEHVNNTNNQLTLSSSVSNMNLQTNGSNAYNKLWKFISKISQMQSLIFRTISRVIGRKFSHNQIPSQNKSMVPIGPPKFIDVISNTLMDLKLASNSKGFLLNVVTSGDQLSTVYQIIESQVSLNETLIVVTGECSKDERSIPFYASGLNPHFLLNTTVVFELPIALKSILDECHGICDNKTFPLTTSVKDGPKKRKIRSGDEDETQQDDENVEESDADLNGNEDLDDNGDSMNCTHQHSLHLVLERDYSSSHRTTSSLAFKFILTTVIMIITY